MRAPDTTAPARAELGGFTDEALHFACGGEQLLGVLSRPAVPGSVGVVVVVGGPQYRAGSHRQFVHLARALAAAGHTVLRFDSRGMGDSSGPLQPFDQLSDDIAAAVAALRRAAPAVQQVVLWGLCDAAAAALLHLYEQPHAGVSGLVLVNPWVRSTASLAKANLKHYYRQRLLEADFWRKLLNGGVGAAAVRDLWHNARAALRGQRRPAQRERPFQERMALALEAFEGRVLIVISERDLTALEFLDQAKNDAAWQRALARRPPERCQIDGADHTCSDPAAQRALEAATLGWLARHPGAAAPGP